MWSWLVIGVIAFVIGPKEMPAAIRKLARYRWSVGWLGV